MTPAPTFDSYETGVWCTAGYISVSDSILHHKWKSFDLYLSSYFRAALDDSFSQFAHFYEHTLNALKAFISSEI